MKWNCRLRGIPVPAAVAVILGLAMSGPAGAQKPNHDAFAAARPLQVLSGYGLFADAARQRPNPGVIPYTVTNPLYSDGALKFRFLVFPPGAAPAAYSEAGPLAFPVGTALVKTFAYPALEENDLQPLRLVETRLLIRQPDKWTAWTYVWDSDMREAHLRFAGAEIEIAVEGENADGGVIDYLVPTVQQCKGCHVGSDGEIAPIGPKIRNLNDDFTYPDGQTRNQLQVWAAARIIEGLPAPPHQLPRVPRSFDPADGTLAQRARGYLDANCAHCHRPGHPADNSGLYLDYEEERPAHLGIGKRPVAAGRGSGGLEFDIVPGDPGRSILLFRMESVDPAVRMPELGRTTVDIEGVRLISEYVRSLADAE